MKKVFLFLLAIMICASTLLLYRYNYIPHRKYDADKFGITPYVSEKDQDGDGIDDQTDIVRSVRAYLKTKPKYRSRYYNGGYPDDGYGVCTDVVAQGLLGAGYDLQELVDADIEEKIDGYPIDRPDKNIDFRRVVNLQVYFSRNAISLTTDISDIEAWQAGDIVVWKHHVGVISDKRNRKGIPFVLHHANPFQASYEEDVLARYGEVIGHYRIS